MDRFELITSLRMASDSRIAFLVLDGLGGLERDGKTELETARTPRMDELARRSDTGMMIPVLRGITPGSGPGHLALFGYDPLRYIIGRGILSALGVNFPVQDGDLTARVNFATLDEGGNVADRRAGRIPDETNRAMCEKIRKISLPGVEFFLETEKEHRAALILRGRELSDRLTETDPQKTGVPPHQVEPTGQDQASRETAELMNRFLDEVRGVLRQEHPANFVLLRGWALYQQIPTFEEVYGLHACANAGYPMYRGLARLAGMEVLEVESGVESQFAMLREAWKSYDFHFVHIKYTDSAGEDGDFDRKVSVIEEVDRHLDAVLDLDPGVLVITTDHSTPARFRAHSWHPTPVLIHSPWCRTSSQVRQFSERELLKGSLGIMQAVDLMTLVMAHAGRLNKFGA
ncbi:MAG: 2,3-bisphosphoglycerate-independent phosphoglycerate mutase [Spirochaetota bacterium]